MDNPNSENILAGAKKTLANAAKITQSVEGNPTQSFASRHEFAHAPYAVAHAARMEATKN